MKRDVYSSMPSGTQFTDKIQVLRSALYLGTPIGQTALYDAIAFGLKQLEDGHHEVRTLIVVSDGGDNASKVNLSGVLRLIQQSRATIYTVGLLDPQDRDLNPGVLRKIAAASGGDYFQPDSIRDVAQTFQRISRDIRNRYSFAFRPAESSSKRQIHQLKVTAYDSSGRRLLVHARTSYRPIARPHSLDASFGSGLSSRKRASPLPFSPVDLAPRSFACHRN